MECKRVCSVKQNVLSVRQTRPYEGPKCVHYPSVSILEELDLLVRRLVPPSQRILFCGQGSKIASYIAAQAMRVTIVRYNF